MRCEPIVFVFDKTNKPKDRKRFLRAPGAGVHPDKRKDNSKKACRLNGRKLHRNDW